MSGTSRRSPSPPPLRGSGRGWQRSARTAKTSRMPISKRKAEPAAETDPADRPLSAADLRRMTRTAQVKVVRRALGLTQEEFSARYRIPLGTLCDWEQGRSDPDQPARAYLRVIAAEPVMTARALSAPDQPRPGRSRP